MVSTKVWAGLAASAALLLGQAARAQDKPPPSSYSPVVIQDSFAAIVQRMEAAKPTIAKQHQALLHSRYDLGDRKAQGVAMSRGKAVQEGVRVKLPAAVRSWQDLAAMTPEEIRDKGLWPAGFLPLPHPHHAEGGMVFPKDHIDEIKRQEGRDLTRFDLDFDLPAHLMPEFPPPIYLTTRPDLGDVSQGKLITLQNYFTLFNGILNPNCHVNGHTNGTTHLVGDIRPQEFRHRLDTPALRGLNVQRLFGSQRALKTVEDFTEFEQRAAYFDGDPVIATKKGVNVLERGSQVHFMSEFMAILDFPPAPKLNVLGVLDPKKAGAAELRGQKAFFERGKCVACHAPPYYTDNTMHSFQTERFFKPKLEGGCMAVGDGSIKTFSLRGIKDSPPYMHDGRLLTLEDTIEFHNLVLETKLSDQEKQDLVAFLRCL
jgi:cytochrome c peroxidase